MKMYGETKEDAIGGDYATNSNMWRGTQSKKVAKRRDKDKKELHRKKRRVDKLSLKKDEVDGD